MPSYLLTGLHKTDRYSNEGGLKYFLLGSFASAILLFGIALGVRADRHDQRRRDRRRRWRAR